MLIALIGVLLLMFVLLWKEGHPDKAILMLGIVLLAVLAVVEVWLQVRSR